jgi:hypothetical protein
MFHHHPSLTPPSPIPHPSLTPPSPLPHPSLHKISKRISPKRQRGKKSRKKIGFEKNIEVFQVSITGRFWFE